MNMGKYILCLYPPSWRERYEDEMLAMLEQCSPSLNDVMNLLVGAVDAQLHPQWGLNDRAPYEKMALMLRTLRASLLTIFAAYVGFIIAGLAFQKLTESHAFITAAHNDSAIGMPFTLVIIGSIIALVGMLVGGLPIVVAVLKHALTKKRRDQLILLSMPLLACTTFVSTLFLLKKLSLTIHLIPVFSRSAFIGVFLIAMIISTWAICCAVVRCEITERLLRFALCAAMLATASMGLMSTATIIWGLNLWNRLPQLFMRNDGIFGSSTPLTWSGIVAAMAIATMLACIALMRGISARSILTTVLE